MSDVGGIAVEADVRASWTGVRDQGARPTCLACATSDAHSSTHGLAHPLSAEFLFYSGFQRAPYLDPTGGLTFPAADEALRKDGQPNESEWTYQSKTPDPWLPPLLTQLWHGGLEPCNASEVVDALRAGNPVVLGLRLVPGFNRVQNTPYIIDTSGTPVGGHAVLGVGLGASRLGGNVDLVLLRNSWGFRWGFGGHAWLSLTYLDDSKNFIGLRTLLKQAQPV